MRFDQWLAPDMPISWIMIWSPNHLYDLFDIVLSRTADHSVWKDLPI